MGSRAGCLWLLAGLAVLGARQAKAQSGGSAVVAVGKCDAAAGIAARSFRSALAQKMPSVQPEVDTARPYGGLAEKTVPQINGAIASARSDFYSDRPDAALKTLQAALDDVSRIAPSDSRWGAERDVLTLLAQVQLKTDPKTAEATMIRILRVDPGYKPDTSLFPPSFQRFVDGARKTARKATLLRFEVTTSPPGKPVYVGGKRAGVGPVPLRVPAGDYRVEADWGYRGLARTVTVPSPPVELSAAVEGAILPDGGPCIVSTSDLATALAPVPARVGASRVFGVHTDTSALGSAASFTSIDASGGNVGEARVQLQPGAPSTEAFGLLAAFAATGKAAAPVEVTRGPGAAVAATGPGSAAAAPVAAGAVVAAGASAAATPGAVPAPAPAAKPSAPPAAAEEDTHATRFEAAVRVGFSLPLGTTAGGDVSLSDVAGFTIPFGVDVGVRIGGVVFVGGYFEYGAFGSPSANACNQTVSCSSNTVRLGGEVLIHPAGSARIDPWFGVGSGFEWLNLTATVNGLSGSAQYNGWEFINLQVGVDFALGSVVRLGPFVRFSMGEYTTLSASDGTSTSVADTALHEWLTFGVRLVLLP
jgi:hypothetical protein